MFADDQVTVEGAFEVVAARLTRLLYQSVLSGVSEGAYEDGLAVLLRAGPFGNRRGASKLVRVRFAPPARRGATLSVPLRWEATGPAGELFPVLDADLVMAPHGDDQTLLMLTGSYRPPFGRAGALLDRAILSRVATATIRSLLHGLAAAITDPAPQHQPAHRDGRAVAGPRSTRAVAPCRPQAV